MQKLVITWQDFPDTSILCVEYESVEKYLADLEDEIGNIIKFNQIKEKVISKAQLKLNPIKLELEFKGKHTNAQRLKLLKQKQKLEETIQERSKEIVQYFEFGELPCSSFIEYVDNNPRWRYAIFKPPYVQTLDDWFEQNKKYH